MVNRGSGPQGSQGDVPLMDSSADRALVDVIQASGGLLGLLKKSSNSPSFFKAVIMRELSGVGPQGRSAAQPRRNNLDLCNSVEGRRTLWG